MFIKYEESCSGNKVENQCEDENSGKVAESIDEESLSFQHSLHPKRRAVFRFIVDRFGDVANTAVENCQKFISDKPISAGPLLFLDCLHLLEENLHVGPVIPLVELEEVQLIKPSEGAEDSS